MLDLEACRAALSQERPALGGALHKVNQSTVEARLPGASTGAIYRIPGREGRPDLMAEVVGFRQSDAILAPFSEPRGVRPGDPVLPEGMTDEQLVSDSMLGRVLDPLGRPLDGRPIRDGNQRMSLYRPSPNPMTRRTIDEPLETGVSVIDVMATVGRGQRVGLFAGAGVGKSTLLGMLARHSDADVNVVALIGERGREVRSFIEDELGQDGLQKSVVVVATGDASPILRIRASFLAATLAETFRDRGRRVLLLMDSLTRLAHAQREVGLSAGEPPTTRGYPPSVFSMLPRLLERAGNSDANGSLTAFYTVLVDGDDLNEPIADAARSVLDGHIVLSRRIAETQQYPAVDIGASLSRLAQELISIDHAKIAGSVRRILSGFEEVRDLIQVGAYRAGTDAETDRTVKLHPLVMEFFRQDRRQRRSLRDDLTRLEALVGAS
ncbi:MAG: FliI/YscN family ATPase [Myxococcota bacterium]